LVGSSRFASSPPVPLSNLVANVNLDMIGRNPPGTVGAVGADYSTLGRVALAMGEDLDGVGLDVVPDPWPGQQLFRRSDQLEFACRSVASLLFTSGLHADYHRPSDEVDRLDMDKAARVARLVVHLVDRVANAEDPPTWTEAGLSAVATWGPCPSERAP
jgi:Zn-dependent M28 family amino/carboxypeptidase